MMEMLQDIDPQNRVIAVDDQLDHDLQNRRNTTHWAATIPER